MSDEMFELTAGDRQSQVWLKLLGHLREKLDVLRKRNDGDNDEVATAKIRGQIGTLKALIDLDKEPQHLE